MRLVDGRLTLDVPLTPKGAARALEELATWAGAPPQGGPESLDRVLVGLR